MNSALLFVFCGQKGKISYSPDVAPSDYHLFGPMKKMLGGRKSTSHTEVQSMFVSGLDSSHCQHSFLHQTFRNLLTDGIIETLMFDV